MGSRRRRDRTTYWGARYTRSWFTLLAGMPLLFGIYVSILDGTSGWLLLAPLTVVIIGALWLIPLAVVSAEGVRMVLRGTTVPWSGVAAVLDPRPGDEVVRLELTDGRVVRVPGVPPAAVPALRARHTGRA